MSILDQEQDVVDLAEELGLTGSPVAAIVNFCQAQIDTWVQEAGGVTSVSVLEAVVAKKLNVVFEEVHDDDDLADLKRRYVQKGEIVFAHIVENDLTPDTFGTMVLLKDGAHIAVIDCRGDKAARRFFTRWHEIAHLLVEPDCERQVFRSSDEPLERLMDQIAGHVGFYDSIFTPLFGEHVSAGDRLTFDIVEAIRQEFCPHASFQSTLYACHRRLATPLLYTEASMEYSVGERRGLSQMTMFDDDKPKKKLRIQRAVPNDAASEMNLTARWNMRVPESSVIHMAFQEDLTDATGEENLSTWTFSKGGYLMDCEVFIQARNVNGTVMATIQPVECE
ncbi:hypothetical protein [Fuerstiella marisgermanici]|uniref:IrrE N-terminal-like domain-containing protein n=1 Tax=Fuerstiella marisgermanici TaxID=1891926 RepID=A0A1P8WGZ4_9PLAN|nr:hypothetical protein [Fuerstiella marisgermanici]APZ93310.1 hypothetical protein Fuma_02927 [Fuerstiella marisgermanici]